MNDLDALKFDVRRSTGMGVHTEIIERAIDAAYNMGQRDRSRTALGSDSPRSPRDIVLAEYVYWRDEEDRTSDNMDATMIHMGAMAAASNILTALMGHPASWHLPNRPPVFPRPNLDVESTFGTVMPGEVFRKAHVAGDGEELPSWEELKIRYGVVIDYEAGLAGINVRNEELDVLTPEGRWSCSTERYTVNGAGPESHATAKRLVMDKVKPLAKPAGQPAA